MSPAPQITADPHVFRDLDLPLWLLEKRDAPDLARVLDLSSPLIGR